MFNRYTQEKRQGGSTAQSKDQKDLTDLKARKRLQRQRRHNEDLATRANKRIEEWMLVQTDDPTAVIPTEASAFEFEHRERNKDQELILSPGSHHVSANRYVPELQRIADTQEIMDQGLRECKDKWVPKKHGVCPFRQREQKKEIHVPLRFGDTTQPERIKSTLRKRGMASPAWTDTGKDLSRVGQDGFNHIPVGMLKSEVNVRAKAKAPSHLQFKLGGRVAELSKHTNWMPEDYANAPEASGYGMQKSKFNLWAPKDRQISPKLWLSSVTPAGTTLGETSSFRADRGTFNEFGRKTIMGRRGSAPPGQKTYFGATKNLLTMSGTFHEANSEVAANKQLATQVLDARLKGRDRKVANGPNIYGWNDLMKYRDYKM